MTDKVTTTLEILENIDIRDLSVFDVMILALE